MIAAPVPRLAVAAHLPPDAEIPVERPHRIGGPPRRREARLLLRFHSAVRHGRLTPVRRRRGRLTRRRGGLRCRRAFLLGPATKSVNVMRDGARMAAMRDRRCRRSDTATLGRAGPARAARGYRVPWGVDVGAGRQVGGLRHDGQLAAPPPSSSPSRSSASQASPALRRPHAAVAFGADRGPVAVSAIGAWRNRDHGFWRGSGRDSGRRTNSATATTAAARAATAAAQTHLLDAAVDLAEVRRSGGGWRGRRRSALFLPDDPVGGRPRRRGPPLSVAAEVFAASGAADADGRRDGHVDVVRLADVAPLDGGVPGRAVGHAVARGRAHVVVADGQVSSPAVDRAAAVGAVAAAPREGGLDGRTTGRRRHRVARRFLKFNICVKIGCFLWPFPLHFFLE